MLKYESLDPDSEAQVTELHRQRTLCGWASDYIPLWLDNVRKGDRLMYWIFVEDDPDPPREDEPFGEAAVITDRSALPPCNPDFQPIGHIAFDWVDYRGDNTVACRETGTIMLSTFFILRSKQGSGLGNKVMDYMETMARDHLGVRTLTLTTPPASSLRGDEMRVKRGMEPLIDPASKFVPGEWYTRRGYETYKTQPYYTWVTKEGEAFLAPAVFMRKDLTTKT